jgi:hypothetical protein
MDPSPTKRELDGDQVFVIDSFFAKEECEKLIARSEHVGYDEARITTSAGDVMDKDVRNNTRIVLDDPAFAAELWRRARPFLPERIGDWQALGFNERFRFYRYDVGQQFTPHYDGYVQRDNGERSLLTFMIYLNDDFEGGETRFYEPSSIYCPDPPERFSVKPVRGQALVFIHRQLHEGARIVQGRKYVLRTDVMYQRWR